MEEIMVEGESVGSTIEVADTVIVADTQEAADALAAQILSDLGAERSAEADE
jgi:hypothetical protein